MNRTAQIFVAGVAVVSIATAVWYAMQVRALVRESEHMRALTAISYRQAMEAKEELLKCRATGPPFLRGQLPPASYMTDAELNALVCSQLAFANAGYFIRTSSSQDDSGELGVKSLVEEVIRRRVITIVSTVGLSSNQIDPIAFELRLCAQDEVRFAIQDASTGDEDRFQRMVAARRTMRNEKVYPILSEDQARRFADWLKSEPGPWEVPKFPPKPGEESQQR